MQQMIILVCKLITTSLELPNANTALDAERWDWLLLTCIQTGQKCGTNSWTRESLSSVIFWNKLCVTLWPHFRKNELTITQCFKYSLCTSRKVLFRCYINVLCIAALLDNWTDSIFNKVIPRCSLRLILNEWKKWIIPGTTSNSACACVQYFLALT